MIATVLAIPAFYLTVFSDASYLQRIGRGLEAVVLLVFLAEMIIMLSVSDQKVRYLVYNWLSLVIIFSMALSLLVPHVPTELAALLRLLRLAVVGLLVVRLANSVRMLTPGSTPYILLIGIIIMLLSGGGFYWLEPTIHSYWEGVWLAFVSGLTVGYGDMFPTTGPSRWFAVFVIVLTYAVMSLVIASITAFFIGKEEKQIRREMHQDIRQLRQEINQLREEFSTRNDQLKK